MPYILTFNYAAIADAQAATLAADANALATDANALAAETDSFDANILAADAGALALALAAALAANNKPKKWIGSITPSVEKIGEEPPKILLVIDLFEGPITVSMDPDAALRLVADILGNALAAKGMG